MSKDSTIIRTTKLGDDSMQLEHVGTNNLPASTYPRGTIRFKRLSAGVMEVEHIANQPLAFHFREIQMPIPDPLAPDDESLRARGRGTIVKARAFARVSAETDPTVWVYLDEIVPTESGASGIRRFELPQNETVLHFAIPIADAPRIAAMKELVVRAEYVITGIDWDEADNGVDFGGFSHSEIRAAYFSDVAKRAMTGSFDYITPISRDTKLLMLILAGLDPAMLDDMERLQEDLDRQQSAERARNDAAERAGRAKKPLIEL